MVQTRPKLGAWLGELDRLLVANAARTSRERLTVMQIYEELLGGGYDGAYDAVPRYAATRKQAQGSGTAVAFVPLSFAPGEVYQFDSSHDVVLIDGVAVTVKVAHLRLCHSRIFFVRANAAQVWAGFQSPEPDGSLAMTVHFALANLVWVYLIAHGGMATIHHLARSAPLGEMWSFKG